MNRRTTIKIAMLLLIMAIIALFYFTPLRSVFTRDHIRHSVGQLRDLWYGPLVLIGLYTIGCVFVVPASVFILAAGVIWGWKLGGSYAMIGGVLGATASFLVARFLGEGLLSKFGRTGDRVRRQVDHAGFTSLLTLRLIPVFPFAVLNYGSGVAGVRLRDFIAATAIGLAPSNFVFAYSADALFNGTITETDALKRLAIVGALLLSIVFIPRLIMRWLKKRGTGILTP